MRRQHVLLCLALVLSVTIATRSSTNPYQKSTRFMREAENVASLMKKRDAPEYSSWTPKKELKGLEKIDISTPEKFKAHQEAMRNNERNNKRDIRSDSPIDLRDTGLLRSIDDQGQCGSCYAFAGTHSIQDDYQLKNGHHVDDASIQHVLECCSNCHAYSSGYCSGGYPNRIVNFIAENGAPPNSCKRYASGNGQVLPCGKCDDGSEPHREQYGKYYGPHSAYVDDLKHELANSGVLLTSFYVPSDFVSYFYSNPRGIYPIGGRAAGTTVQTVGGHAVEIVGWGVSGGRDYWIVKNSYSTSWGDRGYFKWDIEDSQIYGLVKNVVISGDDSKKRQDGGRGGLALFGSDENMGGLMDVDNADEEVQEAARFAVAEINELCDGEVYVLEKVLDTQVQPVVGSKYHIYLQASPASKFGEDECTQQYHAHVIVDSEGNFDLFNFRSLEPDVGVDLLLEEEKAVDVLSDDDDDDHESGKEGLLPSLVVCLFAFLFSLF